MSRKASRPCPDPQLLCALTRDFRGVSMLPLRPLHPSPGPRKPGTLQTWVGRFSRVFCCHDGRSSCCTRSCAELCAATILCWDQRQDFDQKGFQTVHFSGKARPGLSIVRCSPCDSAHPKSNLLPFVLQTAAQRKDPVKAKASLAVNLASTHRPGLGNGQGRSGLIILK